VRTIFQIGFTLYKQGKSEEAEPFYQDALNRRNFLLGPGAADTIECAFWLGRALFDLKNYHESEEAFRRTITRRQDSRDMSTNHWLGLAMYCQGKYKQAILFLRRAFSLRNAKCGEHDLDTLSSSYWLGMAYYYQARYVEAEPLLFQALSGMKKRTMFPRLPNQDMLDCLCWNEEVLQLQGKNEMAELARRDILRDHRIVLGLDYPNPNPLLTVRGWVRSLEPQEKFLGANSGLKQWA
jgi:tetratricopeptide (TPR) repeat protein